MHILHLASQSPSRAYLLQQARIPFVTIPQEADEKFLAWEGALDVLVLAIARHKMAHALLPTQSTPSGRLYVLTADTLSEDLDGTIHGKPADHDDARAKIISARNGTRLCTAYLLHVYRWHEGQWVVENAIERTVWATFRFNIPDHWVDRYLANSIGLNTANAIAIEEYGSQFLEWVDGSYSTIVGLPLYELREDLDKSGFFGDSHT